MNTYTLRELSEDLDISIKALRDYIHKGVLCATKVGRCYLVKACDLDKFLEITTRFPMRNYLCENYDKCLQEAAQVNKVFDCENCPRLSYGKERYEILLKSYRINVSPR